ncbi:MAG: class II aldolase/adducin family protein [Anaerolineae bacterium]|nr:class II aldolase/adducin family protein [Anaerolineae bacterium]
MNERALRQQLSDIGRQAVAYGLVKAISGNLSARLPGADEFLITPSGDALDALIPDELVCMGLDGQVRAGTRKPSSEYLLHLAIYRRRPEINAIVHLHPPLATVVGTALGEVRPVTFEGLYFLGQVAIVPAILPGTEELAQAAAEATDHSRVLILQHHGSVCVGSTLQEALYRSIELEETCRLIVISRAIGAEAYLPGWAVERMRGRGY